MGSLLVNSIADDRGRVVRVLPPWRLSAVGRRGVGLSPAQSARIQGAGERGMDRQSRIVGAVYGAMLGMGGFLMLPLLFIAKPAVRGVVLGSAIQVAWIGAVAWVLARRWPTGRVAGVCARAMAKEGRCAGCGYPLDLHRVEEDGCVACPECGAAWRVGGRGGEASSL